MHIFSFPFCFGAFLSEVNISGKAGRGEPPPFFGVTRKRGFINVEDGGISVFEVSKGEILKDLPDAEAGRIGVRLLRTTGYHTRARSCVLFCGLESPLHGDWK